MSKSLLSRFSFLNNIPNVIALSLVVSSALILIWIGAIVWKDISFWNKEIGSIFFGSRTGEPISLGIGMKLVYYFFIGLTFLLFGIVLLVHNFRSCPFYFGYLGSIYRKRNHFSLKCFKCPLEKDCRMTDNRSRVPK